MSHAAEAPQPHAMLARFADPDDLLAAAKKAKSDGFTKLDAYSPYPVHGLAEAIGFEDSRVQWTIFLGGVAGACGGLLLQWWVSALGYPHNVGGKPFFSLPAFVPVLFECTVLLAAFSAVAAVLIYNGLPRPHHPVFSAPGFDRASQDAFFLAIEAGDPKYDSNETRKYLSSLGAEEVSEVENEE